MVTSQTPIATSTHGTIFPAFILWLLPALASEQIKVDLAAYTSQISYLYAVWLLFLWFGMFSVWTNYYLDILIITDRRLILINQKGFFRRNVGSFRLERMQDINVEINGLIATLLDYGTIHVETAGHGDEEFRATDLPKPREIKAEILRAGDSRIPAKDMTGISE